jgi:ribosomal protein S1
MSNENINGEDIAMDNFEKLISNTLKQPVKGSNVSGKVVMIHNDEVIVDIGMKTEGVVARNELVGEIHVGDELELVVVGYSGGHGYMQLSTSKAFTDKGDFGRDHVGKIVKVKIDSHMEKGFKGKVGETDAFVPETHIDLKNCLKEPAAYIGQILDAKVLKVGNKGRYRSLLVSPRDYLIDKHSKERMDFFDRLTVGEVVKGTVRSIKDYGAFINLGVADGFLHKSNTAWGRPKNPSKYVTEGDIIDVMILEVNKENGRIEVGIKQMTEDPWSTVRERYPTGSIVSATIIGRRRAGYIGEVEPGIDAIIPLEELSWLKNGRVNLPPKSIAEGRVLEYDDERNRVVISLRMMIDNPWKTIKQELPEGSIVECTIKSVTDFGLFVDFGRFIEGLIRKGDISWVEEPRDLKELYKVGDVIEAKLLIIDEARERVGLGIKQLSSNPWKDISKGIKEVNVTVSEITKNGLNVTLANGIKATIPQNELDPSKQNLDSYKVGDSFPAMIVKGDAKEHTVTLSVRKLITESERKETKEYMKKLEKGDENQAFGLVFKDMLGKSDE